MMLALLIPFAILVIIMYQDKAEDEVKNPCPGCNKAVSSSHSFCPYCGFQHKRVCRCCQKQVHWDWRQCPHCGTPGDEGS